MIDAHTHTKFSFDGESAAEDMAKRGQELGLKYMAFTDHLDRDYAHILRYKNIRQLNVAKYVDAISEMKERYPFLALGIECGYSELAEKDYAELIPYDKMDYVINSIHTIDGLDCYNYDYFADKTVFEAFSKYLLKVLKSVDAPYDFDTITHIGFVRKNAPYEDVSMPMSVYGDIIDEILKRIIARDKTLELNSKIKYRDFMPTAEVVARYYELGGRNITFASDAHVTTKVGNMYAEAADLAKSIGFKYWTVYRERKPIKMEIE